MISFDSCACLMIYRRNVIVYSKLVHDVSVAYCCISVHDVSVAYCCISVHDGWWLNNVIVYD